MTSAALPAAPRLRAWTTTRSFELRLTGTLLAIGVAYHYSLLTLIRALDLDTPLAYLGMVPFMALGLGLLRARPEASEPTLHDREIDYLVGTPLLVASLLVVMLLPSQLSSLFWVWRVDLLSLPFFVAGVVTLVFGLRTCWRLRLPIGFLLLAWPVPYTALLGRWLDGFTSLTVWALKAVLQHIHVGIPVAGSDGSLFSVTHHGTPFVLSVASSCSGVNGVVGFLLVGVAFASLVRGKRAVKAVWLLLGMTVIWALNVARLVLLFWAGTHFGETAAVDGLHPFVGVVLFCAGIGLMVITMRPLGLTIPRSPARVTDRPASTPYHRIAVPRVGVALALLLSLTTMMGVANAGMKHYELVAGDLGGARLTSFTTQPAEVPGFAVTPTASYDWARRFFGSSSTWNRYTYSGQTSSRPVSIIADVVSTSSLSRLSDYGIEACYRFHGYDVSAQQSFALGGGVTGNLLTYVNHKQSVRWSVVYWIWPVKDGAHEHFERVALLMSSGLAATHDGSATPRQDPVGGLTTAYTARPSSTQPASRTASDLDQTRAYLTSFAKTLVHDRAATSR